MHFLQFITVSYTVYISVKMVLIDIGAHSEHVQVIRCDINPGSVEKSGDVENGTISQKI
jgi:hypothetical protein